MYTVDEWHDFYVMVGGAAAVLTGLIFVVISIHLRQVIATPLFRARARYLTAGLMLSLLTSGLVLVPRQSVTVLGVELIALGLALAAAFPVPVARMVLRPESAASVDVRLRQLPGERSVGDRADDRPAAQCGTGGQRSATGQLRPERRCEV